MKKRFNYLFLVFSVFALFIFCTQIVSAYSITAFGTTGDQPRGMVMDPSGNIYVANRNSTQVTKITPAGVSSTFATLSANSWGITIDPDGNLYVTNTVPKTVTKITPAGVSSLFAGTIDGPYDIIRDNDGNFYTQNANNVTKITPLGVSSTLGVTGLYPSEFLIDAGGNIFGANAGADTIYKLTQAGVTTVVGSTGGDPEDIIMDADGNLYTANRDSSNVTKTTQAGVMTIFGTTGTGPRGLVMDAAGNIYTANLDAGTVSKITPAGVSTIIGTAGINPWAILLDSDNNVYVANIGSDTVTKITNPTVTEVTSITTPTTDMTPDYVFNSNSAGTITYGGSCTSVTADAIVGDNTITFNSLLGGTYDDCTIIVTDEFGPSNTLLVSEFTIAPVSIAITTPATKLSYTVGEALSISGLVVTGTYENASTQIETITSSNISGFDSSVPVVGQTLTITFAGQTTTYTVDIVAAPQQFSSGSYMHGYGSMYSSTYCLPGYLFNPRTGKACTTSTTTNSKFIFTKNLKHLITDSEVKELQKFLNAHNYSVAITGAGSPGFETNYFRSLTKRALIRFQLANNLVGDGIVGPLTRAVLNK